MFKPPLPLLFLAALGLWLALAPATPARAEGNCPPGYYPIGGGTAGWVGCAPMGPMPQDSGGDTYAGPAASPPPRRMGPPPVKAYMAVAFHWDSGTIWATAGQRSAEAAQGFVSKACEEAMGSECSWVGGTDEVYVAMARDESGILFGGTQVGSPDAAKAEALERCQKYSFDCRIVRTFNPILIPPGTPPERDFSATWLPEGPVQRHRVAAVAVPAEKVAAPWTGKNWLALGGNGFAAGNQQAVAECERQTGGKCKGLLGSAAGPLGLVYTGVGRVQVVPLPPAGDPHERVERICWKDVEGCALVGTIDTAGSGVKVIDLTRIAQPLRGFAAVARATRGPDGIAISAGHARPAEADAAALAQCRASGAIACAIDTGGTGDHGLGPFMAAFIDQAGGTLYEYGVSAENARKRASDWCARDKLTCREIGVWDLSARPRLWQPIAR